MKESMLISHKRPNIQDAYVMNIVLKPPRKCFSSPD